jgi:hypothetical protein
LGERKGTGEATIPHLVEDHTTTGDVFKKPRTTPVKAAMARTRAIIFVVGHGQLEAGLRAVDITGDKHVIKFMGPTWALKSCSPLAHLFHYVVHRNPFSTAKPSPYMYTPTFEVFYIFVDSFPL